MSGVIGQTTNSHPRQTPGINFNVLYHSHMKILASLRKRTKTGISVWHFCVTPESGQCFAVGGDDLKVIPATDRKHLRSIYTSFKRYGYAEKLPVKKQWIADPWSSELPADMQTALEGLSVA